MVIRTARNRVPSDASWVKLSSPVGLIADLNPDQSVNA
jgi:hypothetical protein